MEKLAILGGKPAIENAPEELFKWPIFTKEDEDAYLDVMRKNSFSGTDITEKFQQEFADWMGRKYALAYCNGTMSISAAMYAIGLGMGDEIICPTKTYWGSVSQAINFGASAVFCNINDDLSLDPDDLERCITPKTKAIIVVHYFSYPADMDRIMAIAKKHNVKVIEDVSHAQGAMYKGKMCGTFGDVAAMSLMSGKAFAAGELGVLVTDNREYYERAVAYGHYERNSPLKEIRECEAMKPYSNLGVGGVKGRANQACVALARGQLKHYDERTKKIREAMNYFWDQVDKLPGLTGIRVNEADGSHMGGWYCPHGKYDPSQLGGLSVNRFAEAVRAEGVYCWPGGNFCLHTHEFFKTFDLYNAGKPSRILYSDRDVREDDHKCDPSLTKWCFSVPWFKIPEKAWIDKYVAAIKKVVDNYEQLLEKDEPSTEQGGRWHGMSND